MTRKPITDSIDLGRETLTLSGFVVPYVIAVAMFTSEDKNASADALRAHESRIIIVSLLVGLFLVVLSRRSWMTRVILGLVYLFITYGVFIYWGLATRGSYGRYF